MRLALALLRQSIMPRGHIYRGKRRLVKDVTPAHLQNYRWNLEIEEMNMTYLRFPYLTEKESHGHSKALNKREEYKNKYKVASQMKFKEDVYSETILNHLRVREVWD